MPIARDLGLSADRNFRLDGKVALVTGGGRGIGRAVALALATAGAELVLVSRTLSELEEVAREIASGGGKARPLTGRSPFSKSTSRPSTCCSGSTSGRRLSWRKRRPG